MNYEAMMEVARATNRKRSADERRAGWASPENCSLVEHLRTALAAVEAGVKTTDWPTVCEGIGLLELAVARLDTGKRRAS